MLGFYEKCLEWKRGKNPLLKGIGYLGTLLMHIHAYLIEKKTK